jgi:hypothetical protein
VLRDVSMKVSNNLLDPNAQTELTAYLRHRVNRYFAGSRAPFPLFTALLDGAFPLTFGITLSIIFNQALENQRTGSPIARALYQETAVEAALITRWNRSSESDSWTKRLLQELFVDGALGRSDSLPAGTTLGMREKLYTLSRSLKRDIRASTFGSKEHLELEGFLGATMAILGNLRSKDYCERHLLPSD